jgi:predicted transcriptional regulator
MNSKQNKAVADYVAKTAEKRFARLGNGLNTTISNVLAQKGWTRQQLSRRTGIPHSTLSSIMIGSTRTWNINLLLRVAVALEKAYGPAPVAPAFA